jgi:hypothetical protein
MQAALRPATRPAPRLAPATSGRRSVAVAPLAAKPTKAADFRSLSDEDIKAAVSEGKTALFKLRMAQKTRQVRKERERVGKGGRGAAHWQLPPQLRVRSVCGPLKASRKASRVLEAELPIACPGCRVVGMVGGLAC